MAKNLTAATLGRKLSKRLKAHDSLNFLEGYAMFMGKTQLVEFGLKRLLMDERGYKEKEVENKTLGWTITECRKNGMRQDFLFLLDELLRYRNYFAHEFLSNNALMHSLLKKGQYFTKPLREVSKALYVVEQVIIVHDFLLDGQFWPPKQRKSAP